MLTNSEVGAGAVDLRGKLGEEGQIVLPEVPDVHKATVAIAKVISNPHGLTARRDGQPGCFFAIVSGDLEQCGQHRWVIVESVAHSFIAHQQPRLGEWAVDAGRDGNAVVLHPDGHLNLSGAAGESRVRRLVRSEI